MKWDRAKTHADDLIAEMREACNGEDPRICRMSRKYDPDSESIVWIAEEFVPEIKPEWSAMVGECIYNLRCALDHLWWQLAIDHLGREPCEEEAGDIQFPILTWKDAAGYDRHRFVEHVEGKVAEKAKPLQGYGRAEGEVPLLEILADLSNYDKHRGLRPMLFRSGGWGTTMGSDVPCVDCHIPKGDTEGEWAVEIRWLDSNELQVGDEVFWQKVVPTGPNPDIELDPEITCDVGFGPDHIALTTLKDLGRLVNGIINDFAPLLAGPETQGSTPENDT